jgi:hypothetical protein
LCRLSVEDEWSETTHDRALSINGGPMWFKWNDHNYWHNLRLGGAIRRQWRIPDGNVRGRSVVMFEAPNVVAPPMLIKAHIG